MSKKILIVEDEVNLRTMFVDMLSFASGYLVTGAEDGLVALEKVAEEQFDLIFMDITMPRKDGIETLIEIRQHPDKYGKPVIIMLTNIGGEMVKDIAMKKGANDFVLKANVEGQDLLDKVEQYLS